jgi:hypothetical protein
MEGTRMVIKGEAGIHSYLNSHGFECEQAEVVILCNTLEFIKPEQFTGVPKAASGDLDKWIASKKETAKEPKKEAAAKVKTRKPRVKTRE